VKCRNIDGDSSGYPALNIQKLKGCEIKIAANRTCWFSFVCLFLELGLVYVFDVYFLWVDSSLVVSFSAFDCLERFSEMTCYVLSGTLNYSVTHL